MYESLSQFLKNFSDGYPLLWSLLVMVVIASAGLVLFGFWELTLRGLALAFSVGSRKGGDDRATGHGGNQG
jgi:cytochrome c oxidase subunit IV